MKQKTGNKLLTILLALLVGLMPGMSIPAHAESTYTYEFTTTRFCFLDYIDENYVIWADYADIELKKGGTKGTTVGSCHIDSPQADTNFTFTIDATDYADTLYVSFYKGGLWDGWTTRSLSGSMMPPLMKKADERTDWYLGVEGYDFLFYYTVNEKFLPDFQAPTPKQGLTYTGAEQPLVNPGVNPSGWTLQYSLNNKDWSDSVPKGTNAGNYTVYWRLNNGSYASLTTWNTTVNIGKVDIAPTVNVSGWTYGETPGTHSVTNNPGNGRVSYAYKEKNADDSTYSNTAPVNVGEYTVKATVAETTNYKVGTATADFSIGKAAPTAEDFKYTGPDKIAYTGNPKAATVTFPKDGVNRTGMGDVTVRYYSDAECTREAEPTEVGTYYVGIQVDEGTNYRASTGTLHGSDWSFSIMNRLDVQSVRLTPGSLSLNKGATGQLTAMIIPNDTETHKVDRTVLWSSDDPGIATVDATGLVTGVGRGTTTITATATNGTADPSDDQTATCEVKVIEYYRVWVGGIQATSEHLTPGDRGWSYDPDRRTLTLSGCSYSGAGYNSSAIYAEGDLNIALVGTNMVTGTADYGIRATGNLTIGGDGSLTARGARYGFYTNGGFTINGGAVTAATNDNASNSIAAIRSEGSVCINGGTVNATHPARAISCGNNIQIKDGTVVAAGTGSNGWGLGSDKDLVVNGGDVTVSGNPSALYDHFHAVTVGKFMVVNAGDANSASDVTETFASSHNQMWVHIAPHGHSFTYAAGTGDEANTLTATCTAARCPLDDGTEEHKHTVSLTISAVTADYNGSAYTGASLDAKAWEAAGLTAPAIRYAGREGTTYGSDETAPINAGLYTASVTVEGATASADFAIRRKLDVQSVILPEEPLSLRKGKTSQLTAALTPSITDTYSVMDETVFWSSDNPAVAAVDANGLVTGVARGTATITATATNGTADTSDDQTATCTVKVTELYLVWVGGVQATSEHLSVGDRGWSYDPDRRTLTLSGYSYSGVGYNNSAIYADGNLNIVLEGTNSVTGTAAEGDPCGVHVMGNLTISGTGSLSAGGPKFGLYTNGGFTVNGGSVTVSTTDAAKSVAAIRSVGDVWITGGHVTTTAPERAISSNGNIQVSGGTVNVEATDTGENAWGLGTNRKLVVNGGDVTASGNPSALYNKFSAVTIGDGMVVYAGDAAPGSEVTSTFAGSHGQKWVHFKAHEHSFTYAAGTGDKANTITATCTAARCPLDDGTAEHKHTVTLTISTEAADYSGSAYTGASLDAEAWEAAGLTAAAIRYAGRGNTTYGLSEIAPVNAGDYTASVTVEGATASADFTIGRVAPVVTAPTNVTAFQGQTLAEVALSNPEENMPGTWSWMDNTTDVGEAGENIFPASFIPEDIVNYNPLEGVNVTVMVSLRTVGYTAADYNGVYDTTGRTISVNVTEPTDATVKYGTEEGTYALDAAPVYKDVGEYTVYYQITGTNYIPVTGSATVNITPAPVTVTANAQTRAYGEEDPQLTWQAEGLLGSDAMTGTLARDPGEDVGEYDITLGTLTAGSNYQVSYTGAKLTITRADPAFTPPEARTGLAFTGEAQELVTAGYSADGTVVYSLDGEKWSETIPVGYVVKTYTVWYKVISNDDNHNDTQPQSVTVTIGKINPVYTAPQAMENLVYTGQPQALVTPGTAEGEMLVLYSLDNSTYSTAPCTGTDAGTYTVTYRIYGGPIVNTTEGAVTVNIARADANVTAPIARTLTYIGQAQALVEEGSADGGEVLYALGTETEATGDYTSSIPTATEIGTYYVWYRVAGDNNHLDTNPTVLVAKIGTISFGTPDFTLPASLRAIEDGALEGAAMTVIYVPDTCASVGAEAFKNCARLTQIRLPKDCEINETAFDGCGLVYVFAPAGGTTQAWCADRQNICFIASDTD